MHLVYLESINRLHHGWGSRALKPRRGTPWIFIRNTDKTVLQRILMNVIEMRQIRTLVCQLRIPEVIPNLPSSKVIHLVYLVGARMIVSLAALATAASVNGNSRGVTARQSAS